jgi:two-component system nitrogen regulation response regulator GlnG
MMSDVATAPAAATTKTILIADDDRAIRTVLSQALGRSGYHVRATSSASTLWRWVEDGEGDLVITDVVMPDENGLDLVPRIRRVRPDLRVVVMSAQSTFSTALKATQRGAFEYLPKPFDLKELLAVVGRALATPPPARPRAPRRRRSACRWSAAARRCRRSTAPSRGSRPPTSR